MNAILLLMLGVVVGSGTAAAREAQYAHPELLLEPTELAKLDVSRQFVILDVRPQAEYDSGHVPGALRVDHDKWKKMFADDKDARRWSKSIGRLGIGPESKVVVYDDKGMKDAARIWWILKYWGVGDVRLLNGGWKHWKSSALPTSKARPVATSPVDFKATPRPKRLATMSHVLDLLKGGRIQIVDARSEDEFCGLDKRDNKRKGSIPGAKHLQWSDLINQKNQRFKSPAQLRELFDRAGIDLGRLTASHCNGGGRAAVMAFGLELMGAKDVRNYYRGWGEWGNAENTPVIVPKRTKRKAQ